MRFLEKLRRFWARFTTRHLSITLAGLLIFAVCIFTYQAKVSASYRTRLDAQYTRAFDDLTEYVYGIETSLFKCAAVTEPRSIVHLASDIYTKAAAATACLGQLPLSDANLENTARFLSQVGDFTYQLALSYMNTPQISKEQRQTMVSFSSYAEKLQGGLYDVQQKLYSGALRFSSSREAAETLSGNMQELESRFSDYPALIYDGPFSDHVQDKPPLFLQNVPEISVEAAFEKVYALFPSFPQGSVWADGEVGGSLPIYQFSVSPDPGKKDRRISIQLSKQGGMLLQMLDNRPVLQSTIPIETAKERALAFLESTGFSSMRDSYFEIQENIATINFAYTADDILYYPDLVKVRVAMDSGEILGMEAGVYAANHTERSLPASRISPEEAMEKLSPLLSVEGTRLAVIPRDTQDEALCWELKCKMEDKTFLVYIHAEAGTEEDVLMLLETDSGTLTI